MKKRVLTGINIQFPISRLIIDGNKTIETRTYPIPDHLIGKELAIIETPGKTGKFKARIIGTIIFSGCFKYKNKKSFYSDTHKHCVDQDSPWKWNSAKPKWAWMISKIEKLRDPIPAPISKGIVYTNQIQIE